MPEVLPVPITIGSRTVYTDPETARMIVSDPAHLLRLAEMLDEAAVLLDARPRRPR